MFSSVLAPAAAVFTVLSFSTSAKLPPTPRSEMLLSQATSGTSLVSQERHSGATATSSASQHDDPLERPVSPRKKNIGKSQENSAYKNWVDEEVPWIITDEEREAFKLLTNDEEREKFIEVFWDHRDPTPGTVENEFRDQYYQRVLYANERFTAGIAGSKTDRGRVYIVYGPADEIESHPAGGTYDYPISLGGGSTQTFPFELWRYGYIADIGQDIVIEFVDTCMCGDFHMTMDPNEKDALAHVPAGQQRLQRFLKDNTRLFDELDRFGKLNRAPKFKDLQAIVHHKINYDTMPFEVMANYVKATSNVTLVPLTLEIKNQDMTYLTEQGVSSGAVNIYGQVSTIGGRIAQIFEDTVQMNVPQHLLPNMLDKASVYGKSLPLAPGRYLLEIVVKDLHSDHVGTWRQSLEVPNFEEEFSASSVILADKMERVPTKDVGRGPFVIGDTLVRPRVPATTSKSAVFKRGEKLNVWMQVYNLAVDEKNGKSDARVEFDIVQEATKKTVLHGIHPADRTRPAAGQLTLEKTFSADDLEPGIYRLKVHVRDQVAKQEVDPEARFTIE